MRLGWIRRIALGVFGSVVLGVGIVGAALGWSDAAMIAVIGFGFFVAVFGIVGVLPGGNWKEGQFVWPESDLPHRAELLEKTVEHQQAAIDELRRLARETSDTLEDFLLAAGPVPQFDGMSPEDALVQMEEDLSSIRTTVGFMEMNNEGVEDGSTYEEWKHDLASLADAVKLEQRRQRAVRRFLWARRTQAGDPQ